MIKDLGLSKTYGGCLLIGVVLFEDFEPLDVFGPVEALGCLGKIDNAPKRVRIQFISLQGGTVQGSYGVPVETVAANKLDSIDVLVIPGGMGTRQAIKDDRFITIVTHLAEQSAYCLTVCTGSALLAATGLLDGYRATSNKRAFDWVRSVRPQVNWVGHARWVSNGRFVTSSGVSAGLDMTLGFIADQYGDDVAERIARRIEYRWNNNAGEDPFAVETSDDNQC